VSPQEIAALHKAMIGNYSVGQKVRALEFLGDAPSGDSPGGNYARPGEILVVRKVDPESSFPISVSHENVTDRSFGVEVNEIEVVDDLDEAKRGIACDKCNGG
jgi:hypothetical protein